jgi:hypothetical protein
VAIVINNHGYSLRALFLKSYDDSHIFDVDVEQKIGVKKKQYTFHKRKRKALVSNVSMSRMDKLLFEESICNVGTIGYCILNCCQYSTQRNCICEKGILEDVL